jgi:hypothetical protein
MKPLVDALSRKWFAVVAALLAGIVIAALVYVQDSAGLIAYRATSAARVTNYTVTGLTLPCTAASAPALISHLPAVSLQRLQPVHISTDVAAGSVLAIHYTDPDAAFASTGANALATDLATYCATETASVTTTAVQSLSTQVTALQTQLAPLDAQLGTAKDRSSLVAERDALQVKLITLEAAARTAQQAVSAAAPPARAEIDQADALYVTLKAKLDKDLETYTTIAAQYKDTYARVIGLRERVTVDRQQFDNRRRELEERPLELNAAYRTAVAAGNAAQSTVDVAQLQLADLNARIAHDDHVIASLPAHGASSVSATRTQEVLAKSYEALATQLFTMRTQVAQIPGSGPVSVIGTSSVDQVIRVGWLHAAILSLAIVVVSLLLGILLALLLALLDQGLKTVPQFTKLYGKPVISALHK